MAYNTISFSPDEFTDATIGGADTSFSVGALVFTVAAQGNWTANFSGGRFNFFEDPLFGSSQFVVTVTAANGAQFRYNDLLAECQGGPANDVYLLFGNLSVPDADFSGMLDYGPFFAPSEFATSVTLRDQGFSPDHPNPTSSFWLDDFSVEILQPSPVVTGISRADAAQVPGTATTMSYTVTFSSAVTGVDASDFTLSSSGSASASIQAVSGSGSTYTVTVGDLAGEGTMRLDFNASGTGVINGSGTPVAGGYASGQVYSIDRVPPSTMPDAVVFLADSGASGSDFITNIASQTVSGTLSAPLAAGESVQISLDDGASWFMANAAAGTTVFSAAVTLAGSSTLQVRVVDGAGNAGTPWTHAYVIDTTPPSTMPNSVAFSIDSGASGSDFITNIASQTVSGRLDAPLAAGESVQISLDNGATWSMASAAAGTTDFSAAVTLAGSGTLQVRVVDVAGNAGTPWTQAYELDTTSPGATINLSDTQIALGETATVTITFTEAVTGFSNANLTVASGTLTSLATSDNITYTSTFTPAPHTDDNTNVITLNPAGVSDLAGNAVAGAVGSPNYTVDTVPTPSSGGGGGDSLVSTPADELFDGQSGTDSVVFSGNFADYAIVVENGLPVGVTGPDGDDRFISIERLVFADGILAFDDVATQGGRLYQAVFDRTPDPGGLGFWVGERDADKGDLVWMASHFLHSDEFRDRYGAPEDLSNQQFLELMYQIALDRAPDAGGFSFWMDQLENGYSRERLMVAFSESVENVGSTPADGVWYL